MIEYDAQKGILTINALPFWRGIREAPIKSIQKNLVLGCHQSGVIQQISSEFLTDEVIAGYAKEDYGFITLPPGHSNWANTILEKHTHFFRPYINFEKVKSVLEIGAGSFYLAKNLLAHHPIDTYVIYDPSIREHTQDPRIHLYREYFLSAEQLEKSVDFIVCISCLEHVPDPLSLLTQISRSLYPETGRAYISFPDVEHQLLSGDLGALLHEHISYFTHDSAQTLLRKANLDVIALDSAEDTLRFVVKRAKQQSNQTDSNRDPTNDNSKILFSSSRQFSEKIGYGKQQIDMSLKNGEKVAIHGACNATFNFLYLSHLTESAGIWIFDGDESKQNKYMTSLNRPIVSAVNSIYQSMDKIYIGAMTYFEEIKKFLINNHGIDEMKINPLFTR